MENGAQLLDNRSGDGGLNSEASGQVVEQDR